MTIYIGADHGGFRLKTEIVDYLSAAGHNVVDKGNSIYDPEDDFTDYSKAVTQAVISNRGSLGILLCRNGVGVSISANRYPGIYCALGFSTVQISKAREHDQINILALPADYKTLPECLEMIDVFIKTPPSSNPKYLRRLQKIEL